MKKIAAALLSIIFVLSAAAGAVPSRRETSFFTARYHSGADFNDMKFELIDPSPVLEKFDSVRALLSDPGNIKAVAAGFKEACGAAAYADTMHALALVYSSLDAADDTLAEQYADAEEAGMVITDALNLLARDISLSPCAAALEGIISAEEIAELADYEPLTEEQLDLTRSITELENEYNKDHSNGLAIYPEIVALRNKLAKTYGYDNFYEYAYPNLYNRDYSPADLDGFRESVRTYLITAYAAVSEKYFQNSSALDKYTAIYGKNALDLIRPYVYALSSELGESFDYLCDHALIDDEMSEKKTAGGYTVTLPSHGTSFIFGNPSGWFGDVCTVIHEFGHYNNDYWQASTWNGAPKSYDSLEVHSQGLELLFMHYYDEMFGADSFAAQCYTAYRHLSSIIEGVVIDELERYAYTESDLTSAKVSKKYGEIFSSYGLYTSATDYWSRIPHLFTSPCYYISYATSAAGAWRFRMDSYKDYYAAVDKYLRFTALDTSYGFNESFKEVGFGSPLSGEYIKQLAKMLVAWTEDPDTFSEKEHSGEPSFAVSEQDPAYSEPLSEEPTEDPSEEPSAADPGPESEPVSEPDDGEHLAEPGISSEEPRGESTSSAAAEKSLPSDDNGGTVAAIVIGGLLAAVLITAGVMIIIIKRRR